MEAVGHSVINKYRVFHKKVLYIMCKCKQYNNCLDQSVSSVQSGQMNKSGQKVSGWQRCLRFKPNNFLSKYDLLFKIKYIQYKNMRTDKITDRRPVCQRNTKETCIQTYTITHNKGGFNHNNCIHKTSLQRTESLFLSGKYL